MQQEELIVLAIQIVEPLRRCQAFDVLQQEREEIPLQRCSLLLFGRKNVADAIGQVYTFHNQTGISGFEPGDSCTIITLALLVTRKPYAE
jgi:hypothetical protein